jgi:hypothetical protein
MVGEWPCFTAASPKSLDRARLIVPRIASEQQRASELGSKRFEIARPDHKFIAGVGANPQIRHDPLPPGVAPGATAGLES